ncbi:hypothetical protein ANO11243_050060 [Dothideomycetidae sp. 11243]|nr:hypothetical protein ANO11243_050060 [fungal sp. No.11243]
MMSIYSLCSVLSLSTMPSTQASARHTAGLQIQVAESLSTLTSSVLSRHVSDSQTTTLPLGRTLGYAIYGSPAGRPLFYVHGYPSSRLEAYALEPIALQHDILVVAPDRPGYGLSSPCETRRIIDFPADVRALADHLDIARFAVLGVSGGGPYALACADELPPGMLSAVGLLASARPWEAGRSNNTLWRRAFAMGTIHVPWLIRGVLDALVGLLKWASRQVQQQVDERKTGDAPTKAAKPRDQMSSPQQSRARLLRMFFEAFTQGSGETVREGRLLQHPLGINFSDVSYQKVQIWHGSEDKQSPIENIRWMAKQLPHSELKEFKENGHFSMGEKLEQILEELMSDDRKRK